jgi:hemoglobin/transferrin/lactoferrin receptor protein
LLCAGIALAASPGVAGETGVDEIIVTATRRERSAPQSSAVAVRDAEDIARLQATDLFELTRDIPGLSSNGGPRASGMKFNIRGFSDTEDVIVELDGISRGFEKYRFGSGLFIEPELVSRLEVGRTPSLAVGSGALGGSVRARTLEAAELLRAGKRAGALAKFGYSTNDDGRRIAATAFGLASDAVGLLASIATRNSNDQRLPDGARLEESATNSRSALLKADWDVTPRTSLRAGYTLWQDSGRQPYDATGGQPGFFGTVIRDIDDQTLFTELRHADESGWIDASLTVGGVRTGLRDLLRPGETPFSNAATGNVMDEYSYETALVRLDNLSRARLGPAALAVEAGLLALDAEREITRVTESAAINDALYPRGFNAAQPSGSRRSLGAYAQPALLLGPATLRAGVRWDRYVTAIADEGAERIEAAGGASRILIEELTPAYGAEWLLLDERVTLFYSYIEAFRPPLVDEYFTQGAFGRCIPPFLGDLAPASGVCGELYVPEESRTREAGAHVVTATPGDGALALRLAWFHTDVRHTLESITVVAPGVVGQPGRETRRGLEVEAEWESPRGYAQVGWSEASGRRAEPGGSAPLYDLPGDRLSLILAVRFLSDRLELGYRLEDTHARTAVVGSERGRPVTGIQPGYRLHGAFATLRAADWLELRLAGDNLANTSYRLNDAFGGAPGTEAPGRDLRLSVQARF